MSSHGFLLGICPLCKERNGDIERLDGKLYFLCSQNSQHKFVLKMGDKYL